MLEPLSANNGKKMKTCSRCGVTFECKVNDVSNCQCSELTISKEAYELISKTHQDCLCKACLEQLNYMVKTGANKPFPNQKDMFIENVHYYLENGNWVFTEFYHLQRGECCQNNCRHCPY